jgi:cytochrome c-type biogenesis protein
MKNTIMNNQNTKMKRVGTAFLYLSLFVFIFTACQKTEESSNAVENKSQMNDTATPTAKEMVKEMAAPTPTVKDMMENEKRDMMEEYKNEFELKDVNGNGYKLSNDAGKKVYIKFWATWCPICLSGIDELNALSNEMASSKDVSVITIVTPGMKGEKSKNDFMDWYKKQGYGFQVLFDEGGSVTQKFNVRGYPTSVFIDETGNTIDTRVGHVSSDEIKKILGMS